MLNHSDYDHFGENELYFLDASTFLKKSRASDFRLLLQCKVDPARPSAETASERIQSLQIHDLPMPRYSMHSRLSVPGLPDHDRR